MSSCMTKLKFLPIPYIFRLGKLYTYMLLVIVLSLVKPCDPCWEIYHAPKIKIIYTPHIDAASTLKVRKNMLSSTSKCPAPTLREDKKNMFYQNKCSKFLIIFLLKVCCKKRHGLWKNKNKKNKKWTNKDSPCSRKNIL